LARAVLPDVHDAGRRCVIAAVLSEIAWLQGDLEGCRALSEPVLREASQLEEQFYPTIEQAELAYWAWRAGAMHEPPPNTMEPYATQISGKWQGAASMWERMGCPYEQGMALMDGDEEAQLAALEIFERLGARPISEKLKQQMRARGIRGIPRGPRPATRENRFGLTAREMEVLACVVTGLSNHAIARQFSLSTRTIEHHITSMLQKTGAQSRSELVALTLKERLIPGG
jgi:DNA-binding CsgD family transcriptional regulator